MSAERTDFVDVLPTASLKTLLSLVKGQPVAARDAGLAVENVASYAMGQFLPDSAEPFQPPLMHAAAPISKEECINSLEALIPNPAKGMKADAVSKIDWKNILSTVLPFILKLLA